MVKTNHAPAPEKTHTEANLFRNVYKRYINSDLPIPAEIITQFKADAARIGSSAEYKIINPKTN
jgi:hypothetical protein